MPPPTTAAVRAAAADAAAAAHIAVDTPAIDRVLREIDPDTFARLRTSHGGGVPLRFESPDEHLNFVCVMALLNACSGYRDAFHAATGRGAADNMRRLALGLFLTRDDDGPAPLSAAGLAHLRAPLLAEVLGVSLHTETPHPTLPGIIVGSRGGPLADALDALAAMCRTTGAFLTSRGCADLGAYVAQAVAAALEDRAAPLDVLLGALAEVPGFADARTVDGRQVYIYKKAFLLIHTLLTSDRIGHPALAALAARSRADIVPQLPLFVDNVIPTLLIHWGVLTNVDVPPPGHELSHDAGYRIRAAALAAGSQIAARAHALASEPPLAFLAHVTEAELDAYFWSIAKEPALRALPRLAEKSTMY